jgi:hypothetical protein
MAEGRQEATLTIYEILIKGHLDRRWGVLNRIRGLGLPLISVGSSNVPALRLEGEQNDLDKNNKEEKP